MRLGEKRDLTYGNAQEFRSGSSLARVRDVAPTQLPPRDLNTRFVRQEYPGREFWQDHRQRHVAATRPVGGVHCCLETGRAKINGGTLGG